MKKKLLILLLVLALCLMPTANAANCSPSVHATLALQNNAAHIRAEISAPGQAIEATVVFQQEENCRVVRQYSGWSELTIVQHEHRIAGLQPQFQRVQIISIHNPAVAG